MLPSKSSSMSRCTRFRLRGERKPQAAGGAQSGSGNRTQGRGGGCEQAGGTQGAESKRKHVGGGCRGREGRQKRLLNAPTQMGHRIAPFRAGVEGAGWGGLPLLGSPPGPRSAHVGGHPQADPMEDSFYTDLPLPHSGETPLLRRESHQKHPPWVVSDAKGVLGCGRSPRCCAWHTGSASWVLPTGIIIIIIKRPFKKNLQPSPLVVSHHHSPSFPV